MQRYLIQHMNQQKYRFNSPATKPGPCAEKLAYTCSTASRIQWPVATETCCYPISRNVYTLDPVTGFVSLNWSTWTLDLAAWRLYATQKQQHKFLTGNTARPTLPRPFRNILTRCTLQLKCCYLQQSPSVKRFQSPRHHPQKAQSYLPVPYSRMWHCVIC